MAKSTSIHGSRKKRSDRAATQTALRILGERRKNFTPGELILYYLELSHHFSSIATSCALIHGLSSASRQCQKVDLPAEIEREFKAVNRRLEAR